MEELVILKPASKTEPSCFMHNRGLIGCECLGVFGGRTEEKRLKHSTNSVAPACPLCAPVSCLVKRAGCSWGPQQPSYYLMHLHKLPWRIFAISFAGGMGRPSPNTNGLDLMSSFPNDDVGGSAGELIVN